MSREPNKSKLWLAVKLLLAAVEGMSGKEDAPIPAWGTEALRRVLRALLVWLDRRK